MPVSAQTEAQSGEDIMVLQNKQNPSRERYLRLNERIRIPNPAPQGVKLQRGRIVAIGDSALLVAHRRRGNQDVRLKEVDFVEEESLWMLISGLFFMALALPFVGAAFTFFFSGAIAFAIFLGILFLLFAAAIATVGLILIDARWRRRRMSRFHFIRKYRVLRR